MFENVIEVVFKVFFPWKCIKIMVFSFCFYFLHQYIKMIQKHRKKINLKVKKIKKIENHGPAAQTNTALVCLIWAKIRIMLKLPVFFYFVDCVSGFHL